MPEHTELTRFLEVVEAEGNARMAVRWIDEMRPVKNEAGGYTVTNVQRLTLTGSVNGAVQIEIFEGMGREEFRRLARRFNIELIMLSDNVGR